jgi:hypothetical protein
MTNNEYFTAENTQVNYYKVFKAAAIMAGIDLGQFICRRMCD